MNIATSPDISILEISPTFDISGTLPIVSINNLSVGNNLGGLTWWFVVLSPTQTPIHEGSLATPDITGAWSTFTISDAWPRPFNSIEFSGAPYSIVVYVKDSQGNQFNTQPYLATICRPVGNNPTSKNFYGVSKTQVQVKCEQARISFQDQTNHSYQGQDGTLIASVLRMVYPIDETGTIPAPFVINNFSFALVPIIYSSDTYQFQASSIYDYDQGSYVHVRIRYQSISKNQASFITFQVLCNIDLCPLVCAYTSLIESVEFGTCSDVADANRKLTLINPLLLKAFMGKYEPLCGVNVPELIEKIKQIGGFECDCCNAPTGIIPNTASVIDGYSFSIVPICGDVNGTVTVTGSNIQFNLSDKSYVFNLSNTIPTSAFTITSAINGCTKTYSLNINLTTFATDLANTILSDGTLLNLWREILTPSGGDFDLIVDGGCVFQSTSTFDYTFTLTNIPSNTTYAILSGITKGGVVNALSYQFNLTNISGLQTYLNALGIGAFTVTNPSGQIVQIVSNANPNNLSALTYKISTTTFIATQASTAAGFVAISANQVVQNIINYICGITDSKIVTSQDYTLCYVDPVTKVKTTISIAAGTSLSSFFSELETAECNTVNYITSLGAVTCATILAVFPASINLLTATDVILGTKAGQCARMGPVELGLAQLTLGSFDQNYVNAFCALVEQCGSGLSCAPYNLFQVTVVPFNNTCPVISDFVYSFSGTTFNINQFIFGNTPLAAQTGTVEYRISGSGSYTLLSNTISIATDGTPTPTPSISMSAGISYDIRVSNNCSSPAAYFVKTVTAPGTPPATANIDINNSFSFGGNNIENITINGVPIVLTSGSFPIIPGGGIIAATSTQIGTQTVVVTISPSVTAGQSIEVFNSLGSLVDCQNTDGSTTVFTFGSVLINISGTANIIALPNPC